MTRYGRVVFVLMVVAALAGCRTWQPITAAPGPVIADSRPDGVRLVRTDGTRIDVSRPQVRADSIVGFDGFDPVGAPLSEVSSVEIPRWSVTRTTGLIVAQASLVLHLFALIVQLQPHYRGVF
jgi:hypothetical protein